MDDGGLSPRVRGNHPGPGAPRKRARSIPACAGEPTSSLGDWIGRRVYPRVCGGTNSYKLLTTYKHGLSPRVRGNRARRSVRRVAIGSIPACAGEPLPSELDGLVSEVYPRVCGGTGSVGKDGIQYVGLSPRVRGNRRPSPDTRSTTRSIPACAGEPLRAG